MHSGLESSRNGVNGYYRVKLDESTVMSPLQVLWLGDTPAYLAFHDNKGILMEEDLLGGRQTLQTAGQELAGAGS
jgi:hypothetical protein